MNIKHSIAIIFVIKRFHKPFSIFSTKQSCVMHKRRISQVQFADSNRVPRKVLSGKWLIMDLINEIQ